MSKYSLIVGQRYLRIINKLFLTFKTVKNWPLVIKDYLGLNQTDAIIIKFYSGLKVKVRSHSVDAHEVVTILSGQEYPFKLLRPLRPEAIIIDIGAHLGSFSLYLKNKLPRATFYCFEPAKDNFALLLENIKLNNLNQVFSYQLAVTGTDGPAWLQVGALESNAYSLGQAQTGEPVDGLSLDSFLNQNKINQVDLIKMDCEGAEYEILDNFSRLKDVKAIILEYHRQDDKFNDEYIFKLLSAQGFSLRNRRDYPGRQQGIMYFVQEN
ncbi:MAG: FkbM family methyltransferase [Candidatus Falkowbacteria bacterium]|nr:FkbM family methyltransferase [Candidatus Falkowbacteria bacterium]